MSAITCMHLVEHLMELDVLLREVKRLLKPGGKVYFETPHPKTVDLPSLRERGIHDFTLNFYDDPTHTKPVPISDLASILPEGLHPLKSGISRNWLFAAAYPYYFFRPSSRQKFTAQVHWLGWSAYLIAERVC